MKQKPKTLPPQYPPYDPEDNYLPPWEEVKKGYSKEFLEYNEIMIARGKKIVAAEAKRKAEAKAKAGK